MIDERVLTESLKSGSEAAFTEIYDLYGRRLYLFCLQYVKSVELSREIVQEVFVKLWLYRTKIDTSLPLSPLIFKIAKNLLINAYKKRSNSVIYEDYLIYKDSLVQEGSHGSIDYSQFEAMVYRCINKLPHTQRQVVMLSRIDQLSNKEIAVKMKLSEQTVKNQLSLAIKQLRILLSVNNNDPNSEKY